MEKEEKYEVLDKIIDCRQENQRVNWKKAYEITCFSRGELQRIYYTHKRGTRSGELLVHKWTKEEEERLAYLCDQQRGRVPWKRIQYHFPGLSVIKLKNKMRQIIKARNSEAERRAIRDLNDILDEM